MFRNEGRTRLITPDTDPQPALAEAAAALRAGQLVILPTDTVYGLACRADLEEAVARVYAVKGRDADKALPILLPGVQDLQRVCLSCDETLRLLARAFWPGALTLVVPKAPAIPALVTGHKPSVAVRVPASDITRRVLEQAGALVAVTSANTSGEPPAVAVGELPPALLTQVDLVLDGGPCPGGQASTLLDLTQDPPRVLRAGPISRAQLAAVLRRPVLES